MRIARVFPTKTSQSPDDIDAYFGEPDLFTPNYDEIHISCTFTWDIDKSRRLADAWKNKGLVKLGGCAIPTNNDNILTDNFVCGKYIRKGITITTRGCPNNCSFCFVPKREGKMRELPIVEGNILQDNNILASSKRHWRSVLEMLKSQRQIEFKGGLESSRVTDEVVEDLRGLRIQSLWLAYDNSNADKPLGIAVKRLNKYFKRDKIRCFVLIGYGEDTIEEAEIRLNRAWDIGTLPFAMLYKPKEYTKDWKQFQRQWTRPAIIKAKQELRQRLGGVDESFA